MIIGAIAHCVSRETLQVHNLALDWLTYVWMVWNFGVMGLVVIHWKGPLRLQQGYLIITSMLAVSVSIPVAVVALGLCPS